MRRTVSIIVVLGTLPPLWLGSACSAEAQPVLRRLEQRIRDQLAEAERPKDAKPARKDSGYLGVLADDDKDGVRVLDVRPAAPAEKAGIKKDDLITGVAGIDVSRMADMAEVLDLFPAGDSVTFDLLRGEKKLAVKVVLGRRPTPAVKPPATELPPKAVAPTEIELLQRRIELLERRVAHLERTLAAAIKSKQD